MVIVPPGGGGVAARLRAWFEACDARTTAADGGTAESASYAGPQVEALEPRQFLSATKIAIIGSSSVEGVDDPNNPAVAVNSFRRPLWHMLNNAGYDVDFIGSKDTNQYGLLPKNNDFDRSNEGRSGWRADHFLTGRSGIPKLSTLLAGNTHDGQPYRPDVALLYVGHNDVFGSQSNSGTANEIGQLIEVLRDRNPNVTVIIGLLHDSGSNGGKWVPAIRDLNNRLVTLAGQKTTAASPVTTADINTGFDPSVYTFDGQHANTQGEQFMAERWFDALQQVVAVAPTSGLQTSETGNSANFGVRLTFAPSANVTINLASSDSTEGTISKTSLTFTPQNWNQPQYVTVTGVDDAVRDGNRGYTITLSRTQSNDPRFDNVNVPNVSLTNVDDEGAVAGQAFFDLNGNGSRDNGEQGLADARVFLDLNDNGQRETNEPIQTTDNSGGYSFDPVAAGTYSVRVIPPAGFIVSPGGSAQRNVTVNPGGTASANFALAVTPGSILMNFDGSNLTSEGGKQATLNVRLGKAPTQNVVVTLAVSDASEATLSKTTLVFTPGNWNDVQTVTVTGVDDATLDGHKAYQVRVTAVTSDDPAYQNVARPAADATNLDDESSLVGTAFFDADGDGQIDTGETRFANATVFLDDNGNGKLDAGERSVKTNSSGRYDFGTLAAGSYKLRIAAPAGYVPAQTAAAVVAPGGSTATRDFALIRPVDTAGSSTDTARRLDIALPAQNIDEYLTEADRVDFYRVRIGRTGKLRVVLKGIDTDVRVQLYDKSGRRTRSPGIRARNDRIIAPALPSKVYFIRVVNRDALPASYRLRVVSR